MTLLLIAAWIVGYVLAYFLAKFERWLSDKPWTIGKRNEALIVSVSSWFYVAIQIFAWIICAIGGLIINATDNDKPAKW